MTLLRVESFGHYGVSESTTKASNKFYNSQYASKWAFAGIPLTPASVDGNIISGAPTGSGKAFQFDITTDVLVINHDRLYMDGLTIPDDLTDTMIVGMRVQFRGFNDPPRLFMSFFGTLNDAFLNPHVIVGLGSAGEVIFWDADGILYDTGLMVEADTYNYFEIKIKFHANGEGTVQVGINGEYSEEFANLTTKNVIGDNDLPGLPNLMINNYAYVGLSFGDFYMADNRGTINNDFLGDVLIVPTLPTEDVSVEFTPSAGGDNFAMVDDPQPAGPDEDSTINSTDVLGATDLFRGDGTGFLTGYRVLGIQGVVRAKKLDSGYALLESVIGSGAPLVTANGKQHFLATSYRNYPHVFELNPDTGLPFTISEANAAVFGYHLVDPNA